MVVVARRHNMHTRDPRETNRFIVYVLDNCAAAAAAAAAPCNPLGKFLCLFDLSGALPAAGENIEWACGAATLASAHQHLLQSACPENHGPFPRGRLSGRVTIHNNKLL